MEPTIESSPIRVYCIQHELGGEIIRIRADVMCPTQNGYTFKREGQVVGRVVREPRTWWIEE